MQQPRRLGMSRKQKPQPLLKQVDGRDRSRLEGPVQNDFAPPIASDDEDNGDIHPPAQNDFSRLPENEPPEDSEPDSPGRGDITRTKFSDPGTKSAGQPNGKRPVGKDTSEAPSSSRKRRKLDAVDDSTTKKPGLSSSVRISANHLKTDMGFTRSQRVTSTYSKPRGSQASRGSRGSQDTETKREKPQASSKKSMAHEPGSPDSSKRSSRAKLKSIPTDSFDSPEKATGTRIRSIPTETFDTPKKPSRAKLRSLKDDLPSSPTKGSPPSQLISPSKDTGRNPGGSPLSSSQKSGQIRVEQQGPSSSQQQKALWKPPQRKKRRKGEKSRPESPKAKPVAFIVPAEIPSPSREGVKEESKVDMTASPVLSDLDLSQLSDPEPISEDSPDDDESLQNRVAPCPWCGDLVLESDLAEFAKGRRLNVQMQTKFCRKHKKETAMKTWRERGYPHVEWQGLDHRFEDHREYLLKIVHGKPSHFRNILADKIESGQARSTKKEGNLNPGYYGPRGCRLMCDYLVEEFGELLKENAVGDRVIAGRGPAAFIQSVLVAELAVQLIMEDMDVSAGEARKIMEESKAVGEMIHEEV
ncbi:hypothetical protein ACJZ2D_006810 [Fusarium nematophilum]